MRTALRRAKIHRIRPLGVNGYPGWAAPDYLCNDRAGECGQPGVRLAGVRHAMNESRTTSESVVAVLRQHDGCMGSAR
jgi:hypothetical protein